MEKYKEILENIAEKEWSFVIFWVIVLFIIIGAVWIINYFHFKKAKNKFPQKYNSKKQIKVRRQGVWASICLSVICIGMGALLFFDAAKTASDIKKDIDDNSYITYTGGYYIHDAYYTKYAMDRWLSVDFDNGDHASVYINSFFERISVEEEKNEGKVVYGKNSLIVVDIENSSLN